MKHFYFTVLTQYDGFEWLERGVLQAEDIKTATKLVESEDFTHNNGLETQELSDVREISQADYDVLRRYLLDWSA